MATPIPANEARFTIEAAAAATRGTIARKGVTEGRGVTTDSRAVAEGGIFIALRGESHDGHAFLPQVTAKRPAFVIVERRRGPSGPPDVGVLEVDDTLVALGDLARAHIARWRAMADAGEERRVVAITGSAGKTTTKELTAALFAAVARTHFTAGNLNNRVGVPSMVLTLAEDDRFSVLEMGMSVPGEIAAVADIARPDVAIVTNVGIAHAEGVGGREGVMREKGAVYRALDEDGVAVVNADDDFATRAAKGIRARTVITFGRAEGASYRIVRREAREDGGSLVVLATPAREIAIHFPLPGEAAAIDLAAALAAQEAATGVPLDTASIEKALSGVRLEGRAALKRLGEGITLLDDTYNANPGSMRSALSTLAEIAGARRKVAVIGEMKELGDHAAAEHEALGAVLVETGVGLAIGCGGLVDRALEVAEKAGIEVVRAVNTAEAASAARDRVRPGDAVLVKGSRSVGAEKVVAVLSEAWPFAEISATSSPL